jgi:hypothetical protein
MGDSLPTPGIGTPSPFGAPHYALQGSNTTGGHVLPNPYGQSSMPNYYDNYGMQRAGPPMFGGPSGSSGMPAPSPSLRDDEEIARQLQDMYDAENLSHPSGPTPPVWSNNSPFKSDEEYAHSLAQGFDQHNGKPISSPAAAAAAAPAATGPNLASVEADEKYARQLQKELEIGGRRQNHDAKPFATSQSGEIDIQIDLGPIHTFGQKILSTACANCGKHLLYGEQDVTRLTKKWLDKQGK